MSKNYIIVKDRQPAISEIKNDCVTNCWGTNGESLSSILTKICGRIVAQSYVFSNTTTVHLNTTGTTVSADVQISGDANNCLTQGSDGGLYIQCADVTPGTTVVEAGNNISITGSGSVEDPYIVGIALTGSWWSTLGNSGTNPATNFIGTTDLQPLVFKVNNTQAGFLTVRTGAPATVSGSVILGQFAGRDLGINNGANTIIGHGAGTFLKYNPSKGNQNTFIGMWAGHATKYHSDPSGGRNVFVGQSAAFRNYNGSSLTYVGTFAGELNNQGNSNTGLGRDALRSNIDGSYNIAVGGLSSLYNTTGIKTIAVTNGGSGYTFANVTISAPPAISPGVYQGTATATATVSGGQVIGITVTNPGGGYSLLTGEGDFHTGITVTITGDGTGATASVTETKSGTGNTTLGFAAGMNNKYGNYNINIGYLSGNRADDSYTTLIGTSSAIGSGAPTTVTGAIAIGYNSKVSADYTMALGGTGSYAVNVGINTETARKKLDVVGGDILVHEHTIGRGAGSIATNTVFGTNALTVNTTSSPNNVVIGYEASNTGNVSYGFNTIIGYRANYSGSYSGAANVIIGAEAAYLNHPQQAVAIGLRAMYTQGSNGSIAVGAYSLYNNVHNGSSSRQWNTAVGEYTLYNLGGLGIPQVNTAIGGYAGYGITAGSYNVAIGSLAMGKGWSGVGTAGSSGVANVALGHASLYYQNDSHGNIGLGYNTFFNSAFAPTIGYNIAIGYQAGTLMTTGNYNVLLGGYSGVDYATLSNYMIFSDGQGNQRFRVDNNGNMILNTIQEYADNAAALLGGLVVGTIYRTGDTLKICH